MKSKSVVLALLAVLCAVWLAIGVFPVNGLSAVPAAGPRAALRTQAPMPSLDGAVHWLNSGPLTLEDLRGKVVLVQFWTFSCINWLRTLPGGIFPGQRSRKGTRWPPS